MTHQTPPLQAVVPAGEIELQLGLDSRLPAPVVAAQLLRQVPVGKSDEAVAQAGTSGLPTEELNSHGHTSPPKTARPSSQLVVVSINEVPGSPSSAVTGISPSEPSQPLPELNLNYQDTAASRGISSPGIKQDHLPDSNGNALQPQCAPDQLPNHEDARTALAAIRGGDITVYHNPISGGGNSVVTDLGHSQYVHPKRINSEPMSHDSGLRNRLMHAMTRPDPPNLGFIPKSQLYKLVTSEEVREELRNCEISLLGRLQNLDFRHRSAKELTVDAERICGDGQQRYSVYFKSGEDSPVSPQFSVQPTFRKIFAILLLIERPAKIRMFMEDNVCDADLPLVKYAPPSKHGQSKRWELCRRKTPHAPLPLFKNWRRITMERFEKQQWAVLSPYFARDTRRKPRSVPHYLLPDSTIMPFRQFDEVHQSRFSQVFRAEIHADHHNFDTDGGHSSFNLANTTDRSYSVFAIKRLLTKNHADLKKEVDVFRRVSRREHTHIITLLAIYTYQGQFHLIFPWAGSDLISYWKAQDPKAEDPVVMSRWLVKQCQGLASGLATIHRCQTTSTDSLLGGPRRAPSLQTNTSPSGHNRTPKVLYCRHGDIKPQNILWFPPSSHNSPSRGTLKITDFGTAELSIQDAVPRARVAYTPMYEPPETHLPASRDCTAPVLRTSFDIWSLGCVFLEFITWYFGGWDFIQKFADRRFDDEAEDEAPFYLDTYTIARFFCLRKEGEQMRAEVKRSVYQFMDELHSHRDCTEFFHEFLVMIKEEMLVVEDAQGASQAAGGAHQGTPRMGVRIRSSSQDIAGKLEKMGNEQYRRYSGYFTQGAAWK